MSEAGQATAHDQPAAADDPMQGWPHEDESSGDRLSGVELDDRGYPTSEAMRSALKAVLDPEIGINIVDLGLVYGVEAQDNVAHVTMTLTTMGCPLTELLHQQCTLVLARLPNIDDVEVEFTFSPPWSTDMMSDEAREELRAMGFNV
jgi:metal-sulfur cluster biosynthetic enzyme